MYPTVSGTFRVEAPASRATEKTSTRKSQSERVASSAENSTSSHVAAGLPHGAVHLLEHLLATHAQLVLEMDVAGRDEGVDARLRRVRFEGLTCGALDVHRGARAGEPQTPARAAPRATARTDLEESPSLAIGKPASITSTPSRSSCRARASFS